MTVRRIARCACGRMEAVCTGEPLSVSLCHCEACRRRTGSAFGVAVFYAREDVTVTGDWATFERPSDAGFPVAFHFCPACGTTLWWEPRRLPGRVAVALGAFAGDETPAPVQQVHVHQRLDWLALDIPEK